MIKSLYCYAEDLSSAPRALGGRLRSACISSLRMLWLPALKCAYHTLTHTHAHNKNETRSLFSFVLFFGLFGFIVVAWVLFALFCCFEISFH